MVNFDNAGLFSASGNYLVLTPDLHVSEASAGYLNATLLWRDDVRGCEMFQLFPNNPNNPGADGALQRYDIREHVAGGTEWVEKYRAPMNFPIFGEDGRKIEYLVHQVDDVTHLVELERLVDKQSQVLEELGHATQEMWRELLLRQNRTRQYHRWVVRVLVARHFRRYSLTDVMAELDAPDLPCYLAPGDTAPRSGLYRIVHGADVTPA